MSHIVDKIILHLRVPLLTEDRNDSENESKEEHDRKDDTRNHEPHTGIDVFRHVREMYSHDPFL